MNIKFRIFILVFFTMSSFGISEAQIAFADAYWFGSNGACSGSWSDADCWSDTEGVPGPSGGVPDGSDNVYFNGDDTTNSTSSASSDPSILSLNMEAGYTGTIDFATFASELTTTNDIQIDDGVLIIGTDNFTVGGDLIIDGGTLNHTGSGILDITGNADINGVYNNTGSGNFNVDGNTIIRGGSFTAGTGEFVFGDTASADSLEVNYASTLDDNDADVDLSSATTTLVIGNLRMGTTTGSGSFTAPGSLMSVYADFDHNNSNTTFVHNDGIVRMFSAQAADLIPQAATVFEDMIIFKSGGTVTLSNATLDVDGNFTLSAGTFIAGENMEVAGNWNGGASFNAGTAKVTFDGTDQSLTDTTTFYDFEKSVTSAATLTIDWTAVQTFSNSLTLTGTAGNILSIRSSKPGDAAQIVAPDEVDQDIDFVDVQDSNNTGSTIDVRSIQGKTATNSGNNTGWLFDTNAIPEFNTYLLVAIMIIGIGLILNRFQFIKGLNLPEA